MKTEKWLLRLFLIAITLVWMGVIYSFSEQNSGQSSGVSEKVCRFVVVSGSRLCGRELEEEKITEYTALLQFPVRKAAHMTEYAILACLLYAVFAAFSLSGRKGTLSALGSSFLYACTDELHQRFVSGRAGRFTDVLIDTAGALLGLLCLYFFIKWFKYMSSKRRKKRKR